MIDVDSDECEWKRSGYKEEEWSEELLVNERWRRGRDGDDGCFQQVQLRLRLRIADRFCPGQVLISRWRPDGPSQLPCRACPALHIDALVGRRHHGVTSGGGAMRIGGLAKLRCLLSSSGVSP